MEFYTLVKNYVRRTFNDVEMLGSIVKVGKNIKLQIIYRMFHFFLKRYVGKKEFLIDFSFYQPVFSKSFTMKMYKFCNTKAKLFYCLTYKMRKRILS